MNQFKFTLVVLFLSLSGLSFGSTEASKTSSKVEKNTAKALEKISMAIGREIGDFTIVDQEKLEANLGYRKTQYTINTNDGKRYKCEIIEGSGFYKFATFGAGSGADAMCTDFTKGSQGKGSTKKDIADTTKADNKATAYRASVSNDDAKSTKRHAKAERKISIAIGQEIGEFSIANQEKTEANLGHSTTLYTVNTNDGKTYKCEIMEGSGFYKVATFGVGSGADAMCTDFTKGSKDKGTINKASCNALLKAAGKC